MLGSSIKHFIHLYGSEISFEFYFMGSKVCNE